MAAPSHEETKTQTPKFTSKINSSCLDSHLKVSTATKSNHFANLCKELKGSCAPLADTAGVSKLLISHHTIYYQQEVLRHSVLLEKISPWVGPIKSENQRHSKNRRLPSVEAMGLPRCPKPNFTDFKGTISHNRDSMRPAGWK